MVFIPTTTSSYNPIGPNNDSGQSQYSAANSRTNVPDPSGRANLSPNLFRNARLPDLEARPASPANTDEPLFNLEGEYRPKEMAAPKQWFQTGLEYIQKAFSSSKGLATGLMSQINSWSKNLVRNPAALAWSTGIGGLIAAVMSIKNIFHAINVALGRQPDPRIPSLVYFGQGFLQAGLSAALLAPIFGWRNPLAQRKGGQLIVTNKSIIGAIVAQILVGLGIHLAKGDTPLNKFPGDPLGKIAQTPMDWLKNIFSSSSDSTNVPSAMTPGAAGQAG